MDLNKLKKDLETCTLRRAHWIDEVVKAAAEFTKLPSPSNKHELEYAANRLNWWCDQHTAHTAMIKEAREI